MQRTKSKLLSILLSLVMLLSLLPTTALATTYNDVKVNGVSLGDGEYLTSNAATAASISSTEPTTYVAWYKNGVLTLNNFTGKSNSGIVLQGAPAADLIIKLIGNNTITPYDTGIQGNSAAGSITITADSGSNGNLTINVTNSTRPVFGINGSANSVTISGSADVTINATTTANKESYGIKSSKAVSILDSASVNITCKTPNSSSRSDSCNGIYSDTGVTINTDGTIQIDVHKAGDEAYSYGINSMGTLTLTKVGGMTVRWKKAGVQGAPLLPSSASFPAEYDTNVDTTNTTNCIATYTPKGTTTNISVSGTVKSYNPGNATTIQLMQGGKEQYKTTIGADTGSGQKEQNFSFDAVAPGTYDLVVTKPGHLTYTVKGVVVGDTAIDLMTMTGKPYQAITLIPGDLNNDGSVNTQDYQILTSPSNYGKSASLAAVKVADINGDGSINTQDYQILTSPSHYGKSAVSVNFGE